MVFLSSEQLNLIWSGSLVSWIPDSNLQQDSGFLVLDSGFQSPGFRIPQAKNSWIPESEVPYMGRNFLISDRQQRVRLSGQYSSMKTIMKGVFRRSTLGLILFIIFMNDQMNAHYSRMPITLNCLSLRKILTRLNMPLMPSSWMN